MSAIQNDLRRLGKLELGDKLLVYGGEWMLLQPGDMYLAHIEGEEPELLTCRRREVQKRRTGKTEGKVFPKERKKKLYNLHEVVKVLIMDNPNPKKEKPNGRPELHPTDGGGEGKAPDQRRHNRPIPQPPRGGRTDYSALSVQPDGAVAGDGGTGGDPAVGGSGSGE